MVSTVEIMFYFKTCIPLVAVAVPNYDYKAVERGNVFFETKICCFSIVTMKIFLKHKLLMVVKRDSTSKNFQKHGR